MIGPVHVGSAIFGAFAIILLNYWFNLPSKFGPGGAAGK